MAIVVVIYMCTGLLFPKFVPVRAATHWVVTEDGRIQAQLDSVYNMRRPYDFMSLLKQEERADMLEGLTQELNDRKAEIDKNEDKDTGLEQRFYKTDPDCVAAEKPLPEFDLYISSVLPLENKGIRPEEHIDYNSILTTMPQAPDCTSVGLTLDFSMHAFEHLQGMKDRTNLSGSPELGLKNAIAYRDNVDEYGHLVHEALLRNNTSWVLYNMAAFYWRIKGHPYHVIECVRRALHFSPRQQKDIALISLANVLHRAHYSNEAAVVMHAAIDVSREYNVNHFTLGNIYAVLRDYNKSVICFENTLSMQPDFEAAVQRMHAVKCHAKLEEALEKQHKSLQRTLDELKDYQRKHTHWQQQRERLLSEQASPDTKMDQRVSYEIFTNRQAEVAMGYGEFCKQLPNSQIWCGWDKKNIKLMEADFEIDPSLLPRTGGGSAAPGGATSFSGVTHEAIDYTVPRHPPRYTVKHPTLPESLQNLPFRQHEWPNKEECDTKVVKFPAWNELPTTYLSPENKGYEVKPLLAEAQGLSKGDEHPLPWYPPTCAALSEIPEGPRAYDHIQAVKERRTLSLKLYDTSMSQVLLNHIEARDLTEEEVGQRIMTALKQKIGPSWVLYNLAGLYWRVIGNSYHGIECIRRSLFYAPDEHRDVPLLNLANILYKWGRVDDAVTVTRDAVALNDLEPDTQFFLGNLLAAKGNLTGSIYHYEEALQQNPLHKEALEMLRVIKCYQKFHRTAQSAAPRQDPASTDKCQSASRQQQESSSKVYCRHDQGKESCMMETDHGGCDECKQMCSMTPVKMDSCKKIPVTGNTCEMLETLPGGVSEQLFYSMDHDNQPQSEVARTCTPQSAQQDSTLNALLENPDLKESLETAIKYYRDKGVCSGDDCNKLLIQCFSPMPYKDHSQGTCYVKQPPLYVYKNPPTSPVPIEACEAPGPLPPQATMLANMPMAARHEKPHTKLELIGGQLHQKIFFEENYETIEYGPEDCIIFCHGEKTPGCKREEYRPFELDDPSSLALHRFNFDALLDDVDEGDAYDTDSDDSRRHDSGAFRATASEAEYSMGYDDTMTTDELSEILDQLQRDLEAEREKYEESLRRQVELEQLRYQHADDDLSSTQRLSDTIIISSDPDPTRNIRRLPNLKWPSVPWCRENYDSFSDPPQFESTWVSVTAKNVEVSDFMDFTSSPLPTTAPHCDPSLLQSDLPVDLIPELLKPRDLSYKPEAALTDAYLHLNPEASESVEQIGTRIAYALSMTPDSWVLASLATLHWRVKGDATEAITCAKLAYQTAPDNAKDIPLMSLANILHSSGHLRAALKLLNAALEHAPDLVAIHFATANLYAAQRERAKAAQFYKAALAIQSSLLPALERLLVIQCDHVLSNPTLFLNQAPVMTYDPKPVLAKLREGMASASPGSDKKRPSGAK